MKKTIETNLEHITTKQWLTVMNACCCSHFKDDDIKAFIAVTSVIWNKLILLQSQDDQTISNFLKEHSPVYDDWKVLNDAHCYDKTLLKERERLNNALGSPAS